MCKSKGEVGGKGGGGGFHSVSKNFSLLLLPRFDLLFVNKQILVCQWDYGDTILYSLAEVPFRCLNKSPFSTFYHNQILLKALLPLPGLSTNMMSSYFFFFTIWKLVVL